MTAAQEKLLELIAVGKSFPLRDGMLARLLNRTRFVHALRDVSLEVRRGEIFGVVGESGSGKSTLGRIIVNLMQPSAGALVFRNREVKALRGEERAAYRRATQMVFQDSGSALNPRKRIGTVLHEALAARGVPRGERAAQAQELLRLCGLAPFILQRYPHEVSGGQRQRIGIARALAMRPELLVADEPVSALDVSLQGQIINLLVRLNHELGLTLVFISHDLAVVRRICTRVAVMYGGRVVELGSPEMLLAHAAHPYTQALIDAVPRGLAGRNRVAAPTGGAGDDGEGCRFRARCAAALPVCATTDPPARQIAPGHAVACHRQLLITCPDARGTAEAPA
jgi:peptide/nickel transport system ATP-binding protein